MMEKHCLIIDDDPEYSNDHADGCVEVGLSEGVTIVANVFELSEDCHDSEKALDLDKIKAKLEFVLCEKQFDIVACDYDLSDKKVNGLDIAGLIRSIDKNTTILMYSAALDIMLNDMVKEMSARAKESVSVEKTGPEVRILKKIFNKRIVGFVEREDVEGEIVKNLKSLPANLMLLKKMKALGDLKIDSSISGLKGKSFLDLVELIKRDDPYAHEFINKTLDYVLARMMESES